MKSLSLFVLPERRAICRLSPDEPIPESLAHTRFLSVTRTDDELSIARPEESAPARWKAEKGWRCLTDYIPVREGDLEKARRVLVANGHVVKLRTLCIPCCPPEQHKCCSPQNHVRYPHG